VVPSGKTTVLVTATVGPKIRHTEDHNMQKVECNMRPVPMTYIPIDVFAECMRNGGVKSKYEYYELWDRGMVPTKLMPRAAAIVYGDATYHKSPKIRALRKIRQQKPEYKAKRKAHGKVYNNLPKVKAHRHARQKVYYEKNKKHLVEMATKYRVENLEKVKEYQRNYRRKKA